MQREFSLNCQCIGVHDQAVLTKKPACYFSKEEIVAKMKQLLCCSYLETVLQLRINKTSTQITLMRWYRVSTIQNPYHAASKLIAHGVLGTRCTKTFH